MSAEKVDRSVALFAVAGELSYPTRLRGSWPTHLELRRDGLDGRARRFVEIEVLLLSAAPEERQIGLVPHLEPPVPDSGETISINQMTHKRFDERRPVLRRNGRGDVTAIET